MISRIYKFDQGVAPKCFRLTPTTGYGGDGKPTFVLIDNNDEELLRDELEEIANSIDDGDYHSRGVRIEECEIPEGAIEKMILSAESELTFLQNKIAYLQSLMK